MTPAEPATGQPHRDPLPLHGRVALKEAVTSGVTEAPADPDGRLAPGGGPAGPRCTVRLIEPPAATSRFLDIQMLTHCRGFTPFG